MGTADNSIFMEQALRIAFSKMGRTSPNPAVGAVIVKDGSVISTGGTCAFGCDHAEIDAIKNAPVPLDGAELYVTLEPCCHYGKTPPCAEAIIRAGILKVYIPLLDPNPQVSGKGVSMLRDAGIDVIVMNDMAPAAADLLRPFSKYILRGAPFILHKAAVSLDGKTATTNGDSKWISSEYSRYIVHRLRSCVDAVIIGRTTMLKDDPSLNVRFKDFSDEVKQYFESTDFHMGGRRNFFMEMLLKGGESADEVSPKRVIMGFPEHVDLKQNIFHDDNVFFFVAKNEFDMFPDRDDYSLVRKLDNAGMIIPVEGGSNTTYMEQVMSGLGRLGIMFAMLEGGGTVAGSFVDAGAVDQFLYFISPRIIGRGLSPVEGAGAEKISASLRLKDVSAVMIGDEMMYTGYTGINS